MYGDKKILEEGNRNNEPPEVTLAKLFELKDWDDSTGKAFVGVCYPSTERFPNGTYGAQIVRKERLEALKCKVVRTHTGFLHVELEERPVLDLRFPMKPS
jgi:hypothetical protein